ncbi:MULTISPECIES: hypothetical protein [Pseudomonas]|uniref:Alginate export domain-containing protein n=1 Tax=Pseudomonas juntendi TaxID=2666183 RepID=A0A7W2LXR1_9PSED|nr:MULTISPECIES: hypothetical protein [Pseudomonas]MBA6133608.1 hypothetical protein [Pseudomonas juntendi]MBA6148967.1 hypothetical protein [Pseudomonas juntendi]MCK2110755.1 alginate export family protein [Pseudomonas juntendi]MCK2118089.1 alginate export family protein [Pseudomonas juntendi]MDG9810628.1 alginate export family protein [Pseudomonas juntendi]
MYRTPRNAGVLLALGLVSVSPFTWAGYKFEDGDLSGEFSFSAGGSTITARNINFGAGVKDLRSGKDRGTKTTWQEIYVKPKVAFDYKLNPDLSLLAGGSVVAASTFGDGDAGGNTRSSDGSASVEEAYAGFRAGNWKFTAGRQDYMIGTGFIVMDGNLDTFGDGAYWLGPRTAFRDSALLAWDGGAAQVQAFSLATDDHLGDFRMNGVNLDYDVGGAVVLGATAMKVDALEGHTPARAARDGMQVYNVRALKAIHPALPALELNGEYAVQRGNGDGVDYDANAWYAEADYTFDMLPFAPVLGYRYTHFSGDSDLTDNRQKAWDPLSKGFIDWGTWLLGDVVGNYLLFNTNQNVHQFSIKNHLTENLTFGVIHYQFSLDEKNYQGTPVDKRRFADETAVYLDWTPTPRLYTSLSYNWVNAKSAAKQVFGDDERFSALELYFTYRY